MSLKSIYELTKFRLTLSVVFSSFISYMLGAKEFDIKILMFNNKIYGLTKGQYSPTSELGKVTKSTPMGSLDYPFNPSILALGAGATAYSGYQAAKAARKQAEAARAATAESRRRAQAELAQMQKDSAAQQRQFTLQIEQAQAQSRQQAEQAAASLAQGERAAASARQASNLAIHRSQLQAAIARQSGQSNVGQKKRTAKRATPQHMRTKLSIDSGLGGGGGSGTGASGLGGNVG